MSGNGTQRSPESKSNSHNIVVRNSVLAAEEESNEYQLDPTRINHFEHDSLVDRYELRHHCWRYHRETISTLRMNSGT